jgi:hypothetical protein
MIETKVFEEINVFGAENSRPVDLDLDFVPEPEAKGCIPFLKSKFRHKDRRQQPQPPPAPPPPQQTPVVANSQESNPER